MALPGELKGLDGATCNCGRKLVLDVLRSAAGCYLGYFCGQCGPVSRETGYWTTRLEAGTALDTYIAEGTVPTNIRNTAYTPGESPLELYR